MQKLAGNGLAWYPINRLVKLGSRDTADTDSMAETRNLIDGTQELFVEDGGEMPRYGSASTCTPSYRGQNRRQHSPRRLEQVQRT